MTLTNKHKNIIQKICKYKIINIFINCNDGITIQVNDYSKDSFYYFKKLKIILNCNSVILNLISCKNKYKILLGLNLLINYENTK